MKTRYVADYLTMDRVEKAVQADPDRWTDLIEFGEVSGATLKDVVKKAERADMDSEARHVEFQVWDSQYQRWDTEEYINAYP